MSIQIKSVERPQPGVAGGGVKKHYASPVHDREVSLEGMTKAGVIFTPGKKLQEMLKNAKFTKV